MQDYVTFETALKLKEAGFPQPNIISIGQMTYYYDCPTAFVCDETQGYELGRSDVFAPRATDIMLQLPFNLYMQYDSEHEIFAISELNLFKGNIGISYISEEDGFLTGITVSEYENAAECAAEVWLKLNQK